MGLLFLLLILTRDNGQVHEINSCNPWTDVRIQIFCKLFIVLVLLLCLSNRIKHTYYVRQVLLWVLVLRSQKDSIHSKVFFWGGGVSKLKICSGNFVLISKISTQSIYYGKKTRKTLLASPLLLMGIK